VISTHLDSSLPKRLFADHGELPSLDELGKRERNLHEQAARLVALGLLREQPDAIDRSDLTEDQKKTFFIILKDREEKLEPFASIAAKAQRLLDNLNRKLGPKSVRLNVETGYQVFSANGTPLPLRCLSSGEQHEFVLFHELLFDVQPGSLILIDEPELSLHVTWQTDVLPELLDIARLANLDIVLATHSTYIVGDRADLMVRLGAPV
jgi:predicted ATPase